MTFESYSITLLVVYTMSLMAAFTRPGGSANPALSAFSALFVVLSWLAIVAAFSGFEFTDRLRTQGVRSAMTAFAIQMLFAAAASSPIWMTAVYYLVL